VQFIFKHLITHLHQFVRDTDITDEEWMSAIQFLTRVGQTCSPIRQEMILLSDVLGVSALVDEMNNPAIEGATVSSVLGPFFTEDAPDGMYCSVHECYRAAGVNIEFSVDAGGSIASEVAVNTCLWRVACVPRLASQSLAQLSIPGKPTQMVRPEIYIVLPTFYNSIFRTGFYDTQRSVRDFPDLRGRIRADKDGKYSYRAVVPVEYPIPGDVSIFEPHFTPSCKEMLYMTFQI